MMELKIEIKVPDLAAAISKLADAVAPRGAVFATDAVVDTPAPTISELVEGMFTAAAPTPTPAPAVPVSAPAPVAAPAPAPAAAPVPVTAPTYSIEQLARAGASLVDAGKMEQLLALLAKYGVQAVTQLRPDQFGVFATELRSLGAQI